MPILNYMLLREILIKFLDNNGYPFALPNELSNFMMSSKEALECVLQAFATATKITSKDETIEVSVTIDNKKFDIVVCADKWYFKMLFLAAVSSSSITKLEILNIDFNSALPMIEKINGRLEEMYISYSPTMGSFADLFEACRNISSIEKVVLDYADNFSDDEELDHITLQSSLIQFSFSCRTLVLRATTLSCLAYCKILNNLHFHQVQHLVIEGHFGGEDDLHQTFLDFAQFISGTFPNLKTLQTKFYTYLYGHISWNFDDDGLANALESIPSTIRGSIRFEKVDLAYGRINVKKTFPIHEKLNLILSKNGYLL